MKKEDLPKFMNEIYVLNKDSYYGYEDGDSIREDDKGGLFEYKIPILPDDYTTEIVESFGGEGMGDDYYVVRRFTSLSNKEDFYVKKSASYNSYEGCYWEYGEESLVEPIEIAVIVYEEVE